MNPNPLVLSVVPLSAAEQKQKTEYLTEKLKKYSLEEIAEWELNAMSSKSFDGDSPEQRYYKNLFLVHSRDELKKIILNAYHVFVTPSIIQSVFPSNGVKIEEGSFSRLVIYLSRQRVALDLDRCFVTLGDQVLSSPTRTKNSLVFAVPVSHSIGTHQFSLRLIDEDGEETNFESHFEIIESAAPQREQYWREKQTALKEKLVSDTKFRSLLFTDARAAFAEAGLPLNRNAAASLPPSIPSEHADFFTNVDITVASQMMGQLNQRVSDALAQRDNERIAKVLERLNITSIVEENGGLTASAIKTVSKILQDPYAMLADLGITPTDEEKKYIFPSFPKETADAFAEWIGMIRKDTPPETSPEKQERLKEIRTQIKNDKALYYDWLVAPKETLKKLYPDVSARDLLELPPALSHEEAQARINPGAIPSAPPSEDSRHNSSDLVFGLSFTLMNKFIDVYFTLSAPGLLPKAVTQGNVSTGFPSPFDTISYEIGLDRPGNLTVVNAATHLISLTASGGASVTAGSITYTTTLALTPKYFIVLKENKIFLVYDSLDVQLSFLPEITDTNLDAAIKGFVTDAIRSIYPQNEIYLADQKPFEINVPFADTAVDLHRIHVHDDEDDNSSGELFFEITVDSEKYLFGQYEAGSGSVIELGRFDSDLDSPVAQVGRQYRMSKGNDQFMISIRGVDRDMNVWDIDDDDYLGMAASYHSRNAPGNYALQGKKPVIVFETVWDVVRTVLKILCWVVDVVIWVLNRCGKFFGIRGSIQSCGQVIDNVMGWILRPKTVMQHDYTLDYSISALNPVTLSAIPVEFQLTNDSLYISLDFDIPKVGNRKGKTHAVDFVGNSDLGIAISENLLDKIIRAWFKYSSIGRTKTTAYDDRWYFAHVDFDGPEVELMPSWWIGPVRPDMLLTLGLSGTAGIQEAFLGTGKFGLPDRGYAFSTLKLSSDPANRNASLTFHIERLETWGAPIIEQVVLHILGQTEEILKTLNEKTTKVIELSKDLRASEGNSDFNLNPLALKFNEDEVIMKFSTAIAPIFYFTPKLDFTVDSEKTVTLRNDGNATLVITSLTFENSFFSLNVPFPYPTKYSPLNIFPKSSKTFTVSVDPQWLGMHQGKITIVSNDPVNPNAVISLEALDIPSISVPPEIVFQGGEWEYDRVASLTATLSFGNIGHSELNIYSIEFEGHGFSLRNEPDFPFTIAPQQHRQFELKSNTEAKRYWDTETLYGESEYGGLVITSNDPNKPFVGVSLTAERPIPWGGDAPGTGDEEWEYRHGRYYRQDPFEADFGTS